MRNLLNCYRKQESRRSTLTLLTTLIDGFFLVLRELLLSFVTLIEDLRWAWVSIINADNTMAPSSSYNSVPFTQKSLLLIKALQLVELLFHFLHFHACHFRCSKSGIGNSTIFCLVHGLLHVSQCQWVFFDLIHVTVPFLLIYHWVFAPFLHRWNSFSFL